MPGLSVAIAKAIELYNLPRSSLFTQVIKIVKQGDNYHCSEDK